MAFGLATISNIAGMLTARHASGKLMVGGIDLLGALESESVLSLRLHRQHFSDKADDLSVEIADPQRTWMLSYLPKKGSECQATIKVFNWSTLGDTREFDCGTFFIDEIDYAGPPNVVSIKATSIPVATGIKMQKKYRFWEDTPLQDIASQMAGEHGLALVWDVAKSTMAKLKRVDQVETPDLEFLRDLAKDWSIKLKVFNRQLIMYSEEEYEARGPLYMLLYGASNIISYQFSSMLNDMYAKGEVAYVSPETGEHIEGEFEAPEPPDGTEAVNKGNERVEEDEGDGGNGGTRMRRRRKWPAAWIILARTQPLRRLLNRRPKASFAKRTSGKKNAQFVVVGDPGYLSGLCVQLVGFGIFDGQWFIDTSRHSISEEGYITELQMHMALKGY